MRESGDAMAFEMIVALFVADQQIYSQYREEIAPLLAAEGGRFRYDFAVAQMLKGDAGHDVNRLFILQFPDRAAKERFFSNPHYTAIRGRLFPKAVEAITVIAEYG